MGQLVQSIRRKRHGEMLEINPLIVTKTGGYLKRVGRQSQF